MKMIRSRAARMHSLRFTVVRRSSSMMPIFERVGRQAERALDGREQLDRQRDFLGAVLLRLHDV